MESQIGEGDLTESLGPIITSLLSLVLPDELVDEFITVIVKFMGTFASPKARPHI